MTSFTTAESDPFVAASQRAMSAGGGPSALDALTWWELLDLLEDPAMRAAAFALFRAQGHELGDTPALGALLAQPYLHHLGLEPGQVVGAVSRSSGRSGQSAVVIGDVSDRKILVELAGSGVVVYEPDQLRTTAMDLPGRLKIARVDLDQPGRVLSLSDADEARARHQSMALGRLALAAEILGAAEGAVDLAVGYARTREQFGAPIGRFQAVRHLLAWAEADTVAVASALRLALVLGEDSPPRYDAVVKALAGRNGRRACERTLQVLGGIGFTAEHPHHHFHSRVLMLDSFLGSSTRLAHELGHGVRTGSIPLGLVTNALAASDG